MTQRFDAAAKNYAEGMAFTSMANSAEKMRELAFKAGAEHATQRILELLRSDGAIHPTIHGERHSRTYADAKWSAAQWADWLEGAL